MGEHQALTTAQWEITREAAQDEVALASHQNLAAAYDAGFFDDLVTPFRGLTRDAEPARRHLAREAREAQAGVRPRPRHPGDHDGGQLDAADRRRVDRAARLRASGPPTHDLVPLAVGGRRRGRRGRLRARRRRAAHGPGVRGAAPARPQRASRSADFDLRRDPRGLRVDRADHARRVGVRRVRPRRGSGSTARSAPSTGRGSTCTARRSPRGTRSPRPAAASSRPSARSSHRREGGAGSDAPVRALVSVCAAGGLGLTAILEAA